MVHSEEGLAAEPSSKNHLIREGSSSELHKDRASRVSSLLDARRGLDRELNAEISALLNDPESGYLRLMEIIQNSPDPLADCKMIVELAKSNDINVDDFCQQMYDLATDVEHGGSDKTIYALGRLSAEYPGMITNEFLRRSLELKTHGIEGATISKAARKLLQQMKAADDERAKSLLRAMVNQIMTRYNRSRKMAFAFMKEALHSSIGRDERLLGIINYVEQASAEADSSEAEEVLSGAA